MGTFENRSAFAATVSAETAVTQPAKAVVRAKPTFRSRLIRFLEAYLFVGLLIAVVAFFSFWPETRDTFPTLANLRVVLGSNGPLALIALGALIPLIANQWDLSVGAVAGLAAVIVATLFAYDAAIYTALPAALAAGLVIGLANASLVIRVGTTAVITTLGMAGVIEGMVIQITGGSSKVSNFPAAFEEFGSGVVAGIPIVFLVMIAIAGLVYWVLEHTPFGRYLYAYGSNPEAARLVGINTTLVLASTFLIASLLSALGGILLVARAGGADPKLGAALTMSALAAAFLSATSIKPRRFNVGGLLVAMFLLAFLNSGLNLAGAKPYVSLYVNGLALIVGVALAATVGRQGGGRSR